MAVRKKSRMNKEKAVGIDGIPIECILGIWNSEEQALVSPLDDLMVYMFNRILYTGQYPACWQTAILKPLLKGGDKDDPNNYRGIALLASLAKLFANIIESRITSFEWETANICDTQFGFTRGRRTVDAC